MINSGLRSGLVSGLQSGLSPSWSTGTSFASPSGYETDYWDFQAQTVSGKYDNGVASATLDNTGGLLTEVITGLPGGDYAVWETNGTSDQLTASANTAADSDDEDFSFRLVMTLSTTNVGVKTLVSKLFGASGAGWLIYMNGASIHFNIDDDVRAAGDMAVSVDLGDTDIHVVSGFYDFSADTIYLKSDAFTEASLDVSGNVQLSLSNTQALRISKTHVVGPSGLQTLFFGFCAGANASAYYDEVVTIPVPAS